MTVSANFGVNALCVALRRMISLLMRMQLSISLLFTSSYLSVCFKVLVLCCLRRVLFHMFKKAGGIVQNIGLMCVLFSSCMAFLEIRRLELGQRP